jgi:HK97 family phage major capsid protein
MSSRIPNIRRAINSMRWAMLPEKLEAMVDMLEARARLGRPFTDAEISERVAGVTLVAPHAAAPRPIKGKGGAVAILSLTGIIAPKASMVNGPSLPQGTACESFAAAFDQAMADEDVTHIVIDVDSPGGSVEGVPELAARITSARGKKPITAVANVMAASAAYWIASAADELVVAPSGEVGSIGVYQVHFDFSEQLAQEGITPTIIKAGQFKAEGNPLEPLSADAKDYAQAQIEEFYSMFVGAVAKQRNVSKQTVLKDYGQGRMLLARNAVGAGVADRIGTLESVLGKLGVSNAAYLNARRGQQAEAPQLEIAAAAGSGEIAAAAVVQGNTFSTTVGDAAPATLTLLRENQPAPQGQEQTVPDTASAPPGGAATNASDIAVAAERKRVQEIRKLCREHAVDDANFADTLIETGASVDVAARQILDLKRTQVAAGPQIHGMRDRAADKPFDSLGDQLMAVVRAGKGVVDPRLQRFAGTPSGLNESVGSEGGFLISPDFLPGLTKVIFGDDPILSRVKRIPSAKNIVKYNVLDETSRANGSRGGGVQVFWAAEADAGTPKKPRFRQMVLDKKKVIGLAYLTDELLDDAPASQAIVSDAFTSELAFTIANAVFRGSGAGQPQGFLNSGAVASVAIEAAQTIANTAQSIAINTSKMLARVPASLWGDAVFMYNQELLPKLAVATIGTSGAVPVFMGAGGMSGKPYDTIWGRPAYASELCEAEGTPGDIICVAPSQYAVLGGDATKFAESIHVRFVNDETALRFTTRVDGAPEWVSTITRFKGSGALSPFVTLATRS